MSKEKQSPLIELMERIAKEHAPPAPADVFVMPTPAQAHAMRCYMVLRGPKPGGGRGE